MRIPVEDYNEDDLRDADAYVEPMLDYMPGKSVEALLAEVDDEVVDRIPNEDTVDSGEVLVEQIGPTGSGISVDLNARKALSVLGMFIIMFLLPAAMIQGGVDASSLGLHNDTDLYSNSVVSQSPELDQGRVAGVSDSSFSESPLNNSFSTQIRDRSIAGIPLVAILIILGILLIALPLLVAAL